MMSALPTSNDCNAAAANITGIGHDMAVEFIVWAPRWTDNAGGTILLHLLCSRMNALGYRCAVYPGLWLASEPLWVRLKRIARYFWKGGARSFAEAAPFDSLVAKARDARRATVIYPEIVEGNPLNARCVVRWLLHRPGHHTGRIAYDTQDIIVWHQEAFLDTTRKGSGARRLSLTYLHTAYRNLDLPRSGTCFLIRKGVGKPFVHPSGAIQIDGMSHEEIAATFNRCERFISYDPYTFYSHYAALCGCVSIVVPDEGVCRNEWLPTREERFGLAYGLEDQAWAVATRDDLKTRLAQIQAKEDDMVHELVRTVRALQSPS